jgi:hypothetical protein
MMDHADERRNRRVVRFNFLLRMDMGDLKSRAIELGISPGFAKTKNDLAVLVLNAEEAPP